MKTLLLLLSLFFYTNCDKINNFPVIGILTMESWVKGFPKEQYQMISNTYVLWIQQAGARVIPIYFDLNHEQLDAIFRQINGLLIPGGDATLWYNETIHQGFSQFVETSQYLIKKAIKNNRRGDNFPVWGTCLGFETLLMAITNDPHILQYDFNDHDNSHYLYDFQKESKQFREIDQDLVQYVQKNKAMWYSHNFGIRTDKFLQNKKLTKFFNINAKSKTNTGIEFVSAIEAIKYPIFGTQFHPERNAFVWLNRSIDHDIRAIKFSQQLANYFVNEARQSSHRQKGQLINTLNIYNFNATRITDQTQGVESVYFFDYNQKNQIKNILKLSKIQNKKQQQFDFE